jgi:hypothetical protein
LEVFHKIRYVYEYIKLPPKQKKTKESNPPEIDQSKSWGFFDGTDQGNHGPCGVNGALYLLVDLKKFNILIFIDHLTLLKIDFLK